MLSLLAAKVANYSMAAPDSESGRRGLRFAMHVDSIFIKPVAQTGRWVLMEQLDTVLIRNIEAHDGSNVPYEIPVTAYPVPCGTVIVNSPGSGELKDGRHNRWVTMGRHLQGQNLAAFVTYNVPRPDFGHQLPWEPYSYRGASWNRILIESLAHVVDYALERSQDLCGSSSPAIYLSGFSSGGSAVGAVGFRYPEVKRLLLLSTYDSVGDYFYSGISRFTGNIYLAYGSDDPMAGFLAYLMRFGPMAAESLHIREVPDCDHRFSGATNSRVLSKAFLWAFAGDQTFPSPEGGIQLYD